MIFRIPAGKHRSRPWRCGIYWRKSSFAWVVKFDESCRYDLGNDDQHDTNKLVGVGYLPHHHKDSARFGWRYVPTLGQIELLAYCYVAGQRIIQPLCMCEIGKEYEVKLMTHYYTYIFRVHNPERERIANWSVGFSHKRKLGYRLGLYFGGNRVAPHEMKIQLQKL
jgi:hypothetical protein